MKKRWPLFILFIYVFLQVLSLPRVGMTWDEPSSFFFGRASQRFYETGDRGYLLESEWENKERFQNEPFQYIYGEDVYPPFPFIVSSVVSTIVAEKIPLIHPIMAHHLGLVLIGALGVFAIYGIGITLGWSRMLASGIALLYGTYPTIVSQMRNDAKDVPLMSMMVVFVFFVLRWLKSAKDGGGTHVLYGLGAGVSFGLALSSKPTAAIIIPILLAWFFISYIIFPKFRASQGSLVRIGIGGAVVGLFALFFFFLSWPWLWDNPIGKLTQVWQFFKVVGRGMPTLYLGKIYSAGFDVPWHYPLGILGLQTPLSVLFIGCISLFAPLIIIIKKREPYPLLFVIWILIGMGRFFVPGVLIYAKVRHFIDVMPAFFLLIGVFLHQLDIRSKQQVVSSKLIIKKLSHVACYVLLTTMLVEQLYVIATHFPYEPSYFNTFIGGTKTVAEKKLFDIEYWASGVKDAMNYIDSATPETQSATVYACTMAHLALFYETPRVKVTGNSVGATYTLVPNSASWFGAVASFMNDNHELVYTIKRAGGDLFWVYKHKSFSGWNCGQETRMVYER